ncbi:hypothetical protein QFC21_006218 [Naganishia friedmannii]|uniref:Uncharacterized protein n=1 Tax=Naganishia friedmannii TaxID=89922 RepID=A0ACC2V3K5_9TREE|nr:hypothetical protein QFC21_006218 [Naganishia friedmannii]
MPEVHANLTESQDSWVQDLYQKVQDDVANAEAADKLAEQLTALKLLNRGYQGKLVEKDPSCEARFAAAVAIVMFTGFENAARPLFLMEEKRDPEYAMKFVEVDSEMWTSAIKNERERFRTDAVLSIIEMLTSSGAALLEDGDTKEAGDNGSQGNGSDVKDSVFTINGDAGSVSINLSKYKTFSTFSVKLPAGAYRFESHFVDGSKERHFVLSRSRSKSGKTSGTAATEGKLSTAENSASVSVGESK